MVKEVCSKELLFERSRLFSKRHLFPSEYAYSLLGITDDIKKDVVFVAMLGLLYPQFVFSEGIIMSIIDLMTSNCASTAFCYSNFSRKGE